MDEATTPGDIVREYRATQRELAKIEADLNTLYKRRTAHRNALDKLAVSFEKTVGVNVPFIWVRPSPWPPVAAVSIENREGIVFSDDNVARKDGEP